MSRRPAALALVAALIVSPVSARSDDAAAMEAWGILGTWAPDCAKPAAEDNFYYAYVRREGGVFLDRDGGRFKDSSRIDRASVKPDGMLEYRVLIGRNREGQLNTFGKRPDGRIRIFNNRTDSGRETVRGGRLLQDGSETDWVQRCPPGTVAGRQDRTSVALMP